MTCIVFSGTLNPTQSINRCGERIVKTCGLNCGLFLHHPIQLWLMSHHVDEDII